MSILECFGQTGAIDRLQRARRASRVPHGYIFHGPEGVGKSLLARQWAKLLLCEQPRRPAWPDQNGGDNDSAARGGIDDCCDACKDCRLVEADTHPDLHIITKQLAQFLPDAKLRKQMVLSIDVIREFLIKPAGVYPARNRARVFIVEQAEGMRREAQNALLKTLEEPPKRTFLVLLTSKPSMFLPTIRSRCQSVRFVRLPKDFIYKKLRESGTDDTQAVYWADFCEGRLGWALVLAGMNLYKEKCELDERLSRLSYETALTLAGWLGKQAKEYGQIWQKSFPDDTPAAAERRGYAGWLEIICHTFRTALQSSMGPDSGRPSGLGQPELVSKIAEKYGPFGCAEAIRATYRALERLEANVNPGLLLEALLLEYIGYE